MQWQQDQKYWVWPRKNTSTLVHYSFVWMTNQRLVAVLSSITYHFPYCYCLLLFHSRSRIWERGRLEVRHRSRRNLIGRDSIRGMVFEISKRKSASPTQRSCPQTSLTFGIMVW